jgi:DNA-binding response OmpR family regulator
MSKKRILVVDNDQRYLENAERALKRAGYEVRCALGYAQGAKLLESEWFHLAIIDVRLKDENRETDQSGKYLATDTRYAGITRLLVSKYSPGMSALAAFDVIDKAKGLPELEDKVVHAFRERVRINFDLESVWDTAAGLSFDQLGRWVCPGRERTQVASELEDLFRRLFYRSSRIEISRVFWRLQGRAALGVLGYRPDTGEDHYVVVCGEKKWMHQGKLNREAHAPASGGGLPTLADSTQTTHFYAEALSVPAPSPRLRSFGEACREEDTHFLDKVLNNFFDTVLPVWRRGEALGRVPVGIPGSWTMEAIKSRLERLWLRAHENPGSHDPTSRIWKALNGRLEQACVVTPGGLGAETTLVDDEGRCFLTDFATAGQAPILSDYAAVEAAIRFDSLALSWEEVQDLESRLPLMGHETLPSDASRRVAKALTLIVKVREHVRPHCREDRQPYFQMMLHEAVRRLLAFDPSSTPLGQSRTRLLHVILAAARISEKISFEAGLVVSESGAVIRNGKPLKLSKQQRDLVRYMNRKNWCTGEELRVQLGLRPGQENNLSVILHRLRAKLGAEAIERDAVLGYRLRKEAP